MYSNNKLRIGGQLLTVFLLINLFLLLSLIFQLKLFEPLTVAAQEPV